MSVLLDYCEQEQVVVRFTFKTIIKSIFYPFVPIIVKDDYWLFKINLSSWTIPRRFSNTRATWLSAVSWLVDTTSTPQLQCPGFLEKTWPTQTGFHTTPSTGGVESTSGNSVCLFVFLPFCPFFRNSFEISYPGPLYHPRIALDHISNIHNM